MSKETRYTVKERYFSFRKGQEVEMRDLGILLSTHNKLRDHYSRRAGEPTSCTYMGGEYYDRPDSNKVRQVFLDDLVGCGILEVKTEQRKAK